MGGSRGGVGLAVPQHRHPAHASLLSQERQCQHTAAAYIAEQGGGYLHYQIAIFADKEVFFCNPVILLCARRASFGHLQEHGAVSCSAGFQASVPAPHIFHYCTALALPVPWVGPGTHCWARHPAPLPSPRRARHQLKFLCFIQP